jgi:acyl-CoA dehydrogenase
MPFHQMLLTASVLGIADGPTEVHKVTVARQVLRGYSASDDLWPSQHIPGGSRTREKYAEYLKQEIGNQ